MIVQAADIVEAGENRWLVQFDYVDSKGAQTTRVGEPWEMRGGTDLFLWDYTRNEIRRFKIVNISNFRYLVDEITQEPALFGQREDWSWKIS